VLQGPPPFLPSSALQGTSSQPWDFQMETCAIRTSKPGPVRMAYARKAWKATVCPALAIPPPPCTPPFPTAPADPGQIRLRFPPLAPPHPPLLPLPLPMRHQHDPRCLRLAAVTPPLSFPPLQPAHQISCARQLLQVRWQVASQASQASSSLACSSSSSSCPCSMEGHYQCLPFQCHHPSSTLPPVVPPSRSTTCLTSPSMCLSS